LTLVILLRRLFPVPFPLPFPRFTTPLEKVFDEEDDEEEEEPE
jgi:hypothetical protein